jgi:hypothetical protein
MPLADYYSVWQVFALVEICIWVSVKVVLTARTAYVTTIYTYICSCAHMDINTGTTWCHFWEVWRTLNYIQRTQNSVLVNCLLFILTVGQTANYAVVVAQLHTKGVCHGIHPFIVQLRDEETHKPMPGICTNESNCIDQIPRRKLAVKFGRSHLIHESTGLWCLYFFIVLCVC